MVLPGPVSKVSKFGGGIMAFQGIVQVEGDEFIADGSNVSTAVDGLTYLMHSDDETGLAGLYARQLEAQVRGMEALLRSDDPNARDVCARLSN
jgi:hypothetical protein